ncbi:MAG: phage tail protein [Desulfobacteraceae bacterium]|nr:phage tail protein [Desulfobacteraceae bacterium]
MDPFIAEIRIFAGSWAPRNWVFCDGQIFQIAQNPVLYTLLGTNYGGDGRSTFGIPDMRGRAPMHTGRGIGLTDRPQGFQAGYPTVPLTVNQLPAHTHDLYATSADGDDTTPSSQKMLAKAKLSKRGRIKPLDIYNTPNQTTQMSSQAIGNAGGTMAHENRQPFLGINFILSLAGIFPERP